MAYLLTPYFLRLRLFSLAMILLGGTGLYLHSQLRETGHIRPGFFVYYTNLSNLVTVLYQALLLVVSFFPGAFFGALTNQTVLLSATLLIYITHLVYHFVLLPAFKKSGKFTGEGKLGFGNKCVHYFVPWLAVGQWAFCADKAALTLADALWWLIVPCAYLIFVLLRGATGKPIGSSASAYPYPFMDLKALGAGKFIRNCLGLFALFFVLGGIFVGIGHLIA